MADSNPVIQSVTDRVSPFGFKKIEHGSDAHKALDAYLENANFFPEDLGFEVQDALWARVESNSEGVTRHEILMVKGAATATLDNLISSNRVKIVLDEGSSVDDAAISSTTRAAPIGAFLNFTDEVFASEFNSGTPPAAPEPLSVSDDAQPNRPAKTRVQQWKDRLIQIIYTKG